MMNGQLDTVGLVAAAAALKFDNTVVDKTRMFDIRYLRMAPIWSENSYAIRRKVGALLVKGQMIISDGYNGTPSGFPNICEDVVGCKLFPEKGFVGECMKVVTDQDGLNKHREKCKCSVDCENAELKTKTCVLHAEANAITKVAKSGNSSAGATLYCTDEPCVECSKLIIQAGIRRVVFWREYHSHEGISLLKEAGIEVEQIANID